MNHRACVRATAWLQSRVLVLGAACLAAVLMVGSAVAEEASIPPARFLSALDLDGRFHRIGDGEGYGAVALVFMTTECPISRQYVPELNRLAESLADKPVKFYGVIYDPSASHADAAKFHDEFKVAFPVLFDASGELAAALAPTHVPEAFVLDVRGNVAYRGRIDDQYAELDRKRPQASTHELADAIAATLEGRKIETPKTEPVGCPIEQPAASPGADDVTYSRDIAPILYGQCAECHRPGEVAPFSLLSYEDAAKRAEFLSEVTHSRLMPPWKTELGHGRFLGERRLTDRQIALFEAWAKAGAPEGDSKDLPPKPEFPSGWRLGEPDMVLTAPGSYTVSADGPDVFQHWIIPIDLPEDKTVIGFEFRPGTPSVVHHAILFLDRMGAGRRKDDETPEPGYTTFGSIGIPTGGMIGVWTPGMTPRFFPEGIGMPLRKGTDLVLQLHMHPSGKEESDQSSVALYFADDPSTRSRKTEMLVMGSLLIDIPAGTTEHTLSSSITLPTDVTFISLLPHMHLIGKEMKITATLPDQSTEHLVWIKDWNFYWQDNYVYHDPVRLPEGTRIDLVSRYDNSEQNPLNPSQPPQRVLFGNESTDEMCFALFQVVPEEPGEERKLRGALMQTFMKEWNETKIDDEAKAAIMEEAGKLFGARRGLSLDGLLRRGAENVKSPQ